MNIQLTGLQRTGTNYCRQLLNDNFLSDDKVCDYLGDRSKHDLVSWSHWHDKPYHRNNVDLQILIVKNPYLWIESIGWRNQIDIAEYHQRYNLYEPGYTIGRFSLNLYNLCRLYRDFYTEWLTQTPVVIQYEQLLTADGINNFFNKLSDEYGLKFTDTRLIPTHVDWTDPGQMGNLSMYMEETTQYLSAEEIKIISDTVGEELINKLKYSLKK